MRLFFSWFIILTTPRIWQTSRILFITYLYFLVIHPDTIKNIPNWSWLNHKTHQLRTQTMLWEIIHKRFPWSFATFSKDILCFIFIRILLWMNFRWTFWLNSFSNKFSTFSSQEIWQFQIFISNLYSFQLAWQLVNFWTIPTQGYCETEAQHKKDSKWMDKTRQNRLRSPEKSRKVENFSEELENLSRALSPVDSAGSVIYSKKRQKVKLWML